MREILIKAYLDYINNYLSVDTWAEHNGLSVEQGTVFIGLARDVYNSQHPDA
jgi:hypothetical protein